MLAACRAERDLPQALAAIDLALWDHASRRTNTPLAKLIHPLAADEVAVNATIGADDRAGAAEAAATAVREGFRCVKVKVGIGDDAGRLAAVRAAVGPDVLIRVDANGAWQTPEEALANLRALAPVGLELCEEPIHGVEELRAVAAESPVRIAMDETHAPGSGAAELVCLKISRGGISAVLEDARAARKAGSSVYLASTFDGPLGIAAARPHRRRPAHQPRRAGWPRSRTSPSPPERRSRAADRSPCLPFRVWHDVDFAHGTGMA